MASPRPARQKRWQRLRVREDQFYVWTNRNPLGGCLFGVLLLLSMAGIAVATGWVWTQSGTAAVRDFATAVLVALAVGVVWVLANLFRGIVREARYRLRGRFRRGR